MTLRRVILLGVLLSGGPAFGQAQPASLHGLVTAVDDGTALVGANVLLFRPAGKRVAATTTSVDGYYRIQSLAPGQYRIRISYVGYEIHRDTLTLESSRQRYNTRLSFAEKSLGEVEVTGEREAPRQQAGRQLVGPADLEHVPTPGPSGDLAAYLRLLPGVVAGGTRGGQLYLRGGRPSQTLTLVDGLRLVKPFHISTLFSAFPEGIVKSAEVHTGGFGAEYMGALSSVLDISLRGGNMHDYEGSVSGSSFLTSVRVEGPIRKGRDSFLAIARRSVIRQTDGLLSGEEVPLSFYDLTTRYTLQTETQACHLTGIRTHDRGRINPDRSLHLSWSNTAIGGRCLLFGTVDGAPIDLAAGYTRFQNNAGTLPSPQRSAAVQKGYVAFESEAHLLGRTVTYGVRSTVDRYQYHLDERFTALERKKIFGSTLQGYVSVDWSVGDRFTLVPSLGTQWTTWGPSLPTYEPRFHLTYRPDGTDRRALTLALGKYNQPTTGLTDERDAGTTFTVWRPSGVPAQALHGLLGYRQHLGSVLEARVEGYAKTFSNIPVPRWSPVAQFDVETARADGLAYGAEIRAEMVKPPFYLFVGYGWSRVTYRAARQNLGAWVGGELVEYAPPHDRRHRVNVVAGYGFDKFTASVSWRFSSGRPYTKISGHGLVPDVLRRHPTTHPGTAVTIYHRPYNARLPVTHQLDLSVEGSFALSSRLSLDAEIGLLKEDVYDPVGYFETSIDRSETTCKYEPLCWKLTDDVVTIHYVKLGPEWYGDRPEGRFPRDPLQSKTVTDGLGFFGALYRDQLKVTVDTADVINTCE